MSKYMIFDVESVGLHGEGFAVGFVVIDEYGKVHDEKLMVCKPDEAEGSTDDFAWVKKNVPPMPVGYNTPYEMRVQFWKFWQEWREQGAVLWADCAWPVETRFLAQCVDDDYANRKWEGPYPLHEIATMALMCGRDPIATLDRLPNELPAHNPLHDARQSARVLLEYIAAISAT